MSLFLFARIAYRQASGQHEHILKMTGTHFCCTTWKPCYPNIASCFHPCKNPGQRAGKNGHHADPQQPAVPAGWQGTESAGVEPVARRQAAPMLADSACEQAALPSAVLLGSRRGCQRAGRQQGGCGHEQQARSCQATR